ncbi:MAG TPA: hypothetical protein VKM55_07675 [Candidatus Lokiarchaeia archaeon]|nr:hypothetical protein [Candidatus Lokiarchaeia archaeon]
MNVIDIVIGFGAGLLATIMFNIAPIMQKSGFNQISMQFPGQEPFPLGELLKNRRWFFGFLVNLIAGLPFIVSISIIGISVLQPLTAFGYLLLVYVAVKKLGEKLTSTAIIGVIVLALMPLFLTLSAVSNTKVNMLDPVAITTIVVFSAISCAASLGIAVVDKVSRNKERSSLLWANLSGIISALGSIWTQAIFAFLQSGGYNLFSEIFSGDLFVKIAIANPFVISAIISLIPTLVFTVLGFIGQQVGYKKGNATLVYPVSQSVNILVSITGGIVIFGQQVGVPACYVIAIAFTLLGTLLVGKFQTIISATPQKSERVDLPL